MKEFSTGVIEYFGALGLFVVGAIFLVVLMYRHLKKAEERGRQMREKLWQAHNDERKEWRTESKELTENYQETLKENTTVLSALKMLIETKVK
jgi:heme/copper-type cytochrome/quinol oxidase subunit 1